MSSLVYVISDVNKALAFEWLSVGMAGKGYEIKFILLNPYESDLEKYLQAKHIAVESITCREKRDWPMVLLKLSRLLRRIRPDIIHCHLLQAGILGLTAARLASVEHRIYTRHHSSQHHIYNRKGILFDLYCNMMSTRVVAVSGLVYHILTAWEKVSPKKTTLIPHGFRLEEFSQTNQQRIQFFRERNQLEAKAPVIGLISRFIELKGIQYIIPAFARFLKIYPDAQLLLLNAQGDYGVEIRELLSQLPSSSYRCILFETDIAAAYAAMDIFVHVPIDDHSEAFGQVYVEALAAGKPSIFTLSGIAPDFIQDGENALVVPFKNSEAIYNALLRLWEEPELRLRLAKNGPASVKDKFDLPIMISALDKLYRQCLNPS